jgi:hypothetical protein
MIITKMFKQGLYGTYYFLNKKKRIDQMELINANPDMNLARELWNMLENKWIRQGMEAIMPSIKVNKKIYIPMTDTIMTRENIDKLPDFKLKTSTVAIDDLCPQHKLNLALTDQRIKTLFIRDDDHEAINP